MRAGRFEIHAVCLMTTHYHLLARFLGKFTTILCMEEPHEASIELTQAIRGLAEEGGNGEAPVLAMLVGELRAIAGGYARAQRDGHTLQATALVNEAFLKLMGNSGLGDVQSRQHFFRLAARAMRQILVDHARRRDASKRGGHDGVQITLNDELLGGVEVDENLLDLDQALRDLSELDPRQARLVELRFFAGLEIEQVATVMEVSKSTVEREWRAARAWLGQRIGTQDGT